MGDVFQENRFVAQGDVVEEDQMLVELSHVSHVGYDRNTEFSGQQTDDEKLADPGYSHGIDLADSHGAALEVVFEDNAVGDMLAGRHFDRRDLPGNPPS